MAYSPTPVYQNRYATTSDSYQPSTISLLNPSASNSTIRTGTTSPLAGSTGTSGLSGSNTGGSTTYYSNAPTIGTNNRSTGSTLNNAPATYGVYTGMPMTTQPVNPSSQPTGGNPVPMPTNNFPTSPSAQTGAQTSTNIPGSQVGVPNSTGFSWSPPSWLTGLNQAGWANTELGTALQNYQQILPYLQLQQNSMQYGMDFNEAQRRWDQQFGWTQQGDQFNQNLAAQQQQLAQWTAEQQQGNWQTQFGLDSELGRAAQGTNQYNAESQRQYQQGQLANEEWANRSKEWLTVEQNRIDNMWKSGQLSNQQRELALAELTQQQLNVYRNAQLSQEGALAREGYANQQAIARMNAFGRTQAPRARWVRAW